MAKRRRTYSAVFLDAARVFHRQTCHLVEEYTDGSSITKSQKSVRRMNEIYTINTITNSVMYLDANINEFYRQAMDDKEHVIYSDDPNSVFTKKFYTRLDAFDGNLLRTPWKKKYQLFLEFAGKENFDRGKEPYESIDLLNSLRNFLLHFKSEYFDASPSPEPSPRTKRLLERGISRNPWISNVDVVFPAQTFGPDCTEWAVNSAVTFTDEFHSRIGSDRRYEAMHGR